MNELELKKRLASKLPDVLTFQQYFIDGSDGSIPMVAVRFVPTKHTLIGDCVKETEWDWVIYNIIQNLDSVELKDFVYRLQKEHESFYIRDFSLKDDVDLREVYYEIGTLFQTSWQTKAQALADAGII